MSRVETRVSFDRGGIAHHAGGFPLRPMTKGDFLILVIHKSSFLWRAEPTLAELAFFLWILSPQCHAWQMESGWRKSWIGWFQSLEASWYVRKVGKALGRDMPHTSERAVMQCFDYLDQHLKPDSEELPKKISPPTAAAWKSELQFVTDRMTHEQAKRNCSKEKIFFSAVGNFFTYLPQAQSKPFKKLAC